MKRHFLVLFFAGFILISCTTQTKKETGGMNPFLTAYNTPFNVPPFDKIKTEHFKPALEAGIAEQKTEIEAIVTNKEQPSFENTIAALDASGNLLREVSDAFENLQSANTSDELQKIAKDVSPMLSAHYDDILLNVELFNRVKSVYEKR